jgi:hypothetical protein
MLVLAFAWLALLVVELVWGLTPLLETIGTAIWATFLAVSPCRLPQPTYSHVIAQLWYAYPHCPMILMTINTEITTSPPLRSAGGA